MPQALMEAPAPSVPSASTFEAPSDENALGPRWLPPVVLLAAMAIAGIVYAFFWQHSTELWWWMGHDRHTHYLFGLNLALDVRTGDVVRLLHDFDRIRVWGPVHPVLVATIQLVAGPDHRLAVLPSLAGWILTIWCAFLIPRRLLATGGNTAGLLAAFLVALSPAHRAFATDVMYESLGAGLSLAALYLYLAVVQDGTRRAAVLLGLTLSVLFLHKYNYWLLVVFGILAGEFARQPTAWFQYALSVCRRDRLPAWLIGELRHPLNYIALAFVIAALTVVATGGGAIGIGRWTMSVQEPHNFVHLAYVAFFVRMVLWWRKTGSEWSLQLPPTLRTVLLYHASVIAIWFLLPKRLSYFLWFLSPNNSDQHRESVPFMHGLPGYLQGLQDDYLTLSWSIYLLAGMLLLGLFAWRRMKPGTAALVFFLLIAAYLTCQHPMLKNRFMHSWIAATWVLGAAGLVFAVQELVGLIAPHARGWAASGVCALLIGFHAPAFFEPGHSQEGGLKPNEPSPLLITRTYLPALADAKNPTILSNVSTRFLWTWTFIERQRHQNVTAELKNFRSYEGNPEQVQRWLDTTRSDALVLIDIRPGSTYDWKTDEYVDLTAFKQALESQSVWRQAERWEMPEGVTITLWKKN